MTRRKGERGQVLVLAVLMLGALFGFGAIALDGGNIYADRRSAQAAADSASMAGALAVMRGYGTNQVDRVAELRAERNGYPIVAGKTSVEVNWPPASPHPYAGNWNYIQVIITNRLDTILAHLFFGGAFQHTVQATAHAIRNETLAPGYAVYADNETACPGIEFQGDAIVQVTDGGSILSNSSQCGCGPAGRYGSILGGGNGSVQVLPPGDGVFAVGCYSAPGVGSFTSSPPPTNGAAQESVNPPPLPDCSGLPDFTTVAPDFGRMRFNSNGVLVPGIYDSIATSSTAEVLLQPGIYCLVGTAAGGGSAALSIGATSMINALDVMIYFTDTAGGIQSLGDGVTTMVAGDASGPNIPVLIDNSGEDWRGMLFYVHPNNTNELYLSGGTDSLFSGTIYAPGSRCDMHGNGTAIAFNTQLICDTVLITGTGNLTVSFNPASLYKQKNAIELSH